MRKIRLCLRETREQTRPQRLTKGSLWESVSAKASPDLQLELKPKLAGILHVIFSDQGPRGDSTVGEVYNLCLQESARGSYHGYLVILQKSRLK